LAEKSTQDVSFWIDGREVKAAAGSQLLKSVLTTTEIPHICYLYLADCYEG